MKQTFDLSQTLAQELVETEKVAEELDEVKGFSETKYQKISGKWYEAKTFNLGTHKNPENAIGEVKEMVEDYINENLEGYIIYLMTVDVSRAWEDGDKPVIMRAIVDDEDYEVHEEQVGSVDDLVDLLQDHEAQLEKHEALDLGYSFGNMELSQQLSGVLEGDSLDEDGSMWSVFYLDLISGPDNLEEFFSDYDPDTYDGDQELHMELMSRDFVRKEDGKIYEVV